MRASLSTELKEYPIYKVVVHAHNESSTFVFVGKDPSASIDLLGKKDIDHLTSVFGKNAVNKLALRSETKYVQETMYHDDTIERVKAKVLLHCFKPNERSKNIYMWCQRRIHNAAFVEPALENIFGERKLISIAELSLNLECITGMQVRDGNYPDPINKEEVRVHLAPFFDKVKYLLEPVGFKYNDGRRHIYFPVDPTQETPTANAFQMPAFETLDENAILLESLDCNNNTLHVIGGDKGMYFPIPLPPLPADTIKTTDKVMRDITMLRYAKDSAPRVVCQPSFVQVRVGEDAAATVAAAAAALTGSSFNMFKLFTNINPSAEVPFIKWRSFSKTMFKMHRKFISSHPDKARESITRWTKPDTTKYSRSVHELIIFKIPLNTINIATVALLTGGIYDVKINFRANQVVNLAKICDFFDIVNKAMAAVLAGTAVGAEFPPIEKHIFNRPNISKVTKMKATGTIDDNKKDVNVAQLENAFGAMSPVFSVTQVQGGIVQLLYKRIGDFTNKKNVQQYMNKYHALPTPKLIEKIIDIFGFDDATAKALHKEWYTINNLDKAGNKMIFYRSRAMKVLTVKVKPTKLGCKFEIDGADSVIQIKRIVHALKYAIDVARRGKVKGKATKAKAKAKVEDEPMLNFDDLDLEFELDDVASDDDDFFKGDDDDDGGVMDDSSNGSNGSNDSNDSKQDADNVNLSSIKASMTCPQAPASAGKDKKVEAGGTSQMNMFVLKKLYEADKSLFYFNDPSLTKYAKTCQSSAGRQPVVFSKAEMDYNNKCFPGAINTTINYGTTPELERKNIYSCPKVWCPKSRVALTIDQFENKYHGRCPFPNVVEPPLVFRDKQGDDAPRHVGYLSPTQHPGRFCMPCCFRGRLKEYDVDGNPIEEDDAKSKKKGSTKEKKASNKCVDSGGNEKYIKTESYPLENERYGLLSPALSKFFGNKYCGSKDGGQGLMNNDTDCFLRYGIPLNSQSLFQCIVTCFSNARLESTLSVVDAILKNLTPEIYISLQDGLVCRTFLPSAASASLDIYNKELFTGFKEWFASSDCDDYAHLFNLSAIRQVLKQVTHFNAATLFSREVQREFQIYQSYIAFLDYIKDDNIKKTHEYLLALVSMQVPWLNMFGYNLIVIECEDTGSSNIACPTFQDVRNAFDKERPTVILVKQGVYYEPVHYVKYTSNGEKKTKEKKGSLVFTKKHDYFDNAYVKKVCDVYLRACSDGLTSPHFDEHALTIRQELDLGENTVMAQILGFELQVVAFYTKTNILIPLHRPTPIDLAHHSTFMFMDTFIESFKSELNISDVKKVFASLNKALGHTYFDVASSVVIGGKKQALLMKNDMFPIPLLPYAQIADSSIYVDVLKDGAIFVQREHDDERKTFIDKTTHIKNLFISLRNEVINIMKYPNFKELRSLIAFLRHPSNPMPKAMKRVELKTALAKVIARLTFSKSKSDPVRNFTNRLCSSIGSRDQCTENEMCRWIWVNKKTDSKVGSGGVGMHCKLSVPADYFEMLIERCIEDLLNPIVKLELVKVVPSSDSNEVITFSSQDVANIGIINILKKISTIGTYNMETVRIAADTVKVVQAETTDVVALDFVSGKKVVPRPGILNMTGLDDFTIYTNDPYQKDWLFELFEVVQKRISGKTTNLREQLVKKIKTELKANFDDAYDRISWNPSFAKVAGKNFEPSIKGVLEVMAHAQYYISDYEIAIIASIINCNVFMTSRQTQRNPDKLRCLGKVDKDFYVMLNQVNRDALKCFEFQLYVKNGSKYLLTREDFGKQFTPCVAAKCSPHFDKPVPDGVCPPYTQIQK